MFICEYLENCCYFNNCETLEMKKDEFIEKYGEAAYLKRLERTRTWNKEHREKNCERSKKRYQKHCEEHRDRLRDKARNWDRQNRNMFAFVIPDEKEFIENYDKALEDNFTGWCIHHRLETDETSPLTRSELIGSGLYYNRPASELIFLTKSEHMKLHREFKSKN